VPAPTKNRVPLYVGGVVVVGLGALLLTKALGNSGAPPAGPSAIKTDSTGSAPPIATQGRVGETARSTDTNARTNPALPGNPKGSVNPPTGNPTNFAKSTGSVVEQLRALQTPAKDSTKADKVNDQLDALAPRAKTSTELRMLAIIRADVARATGKREEGCRILENALAKVDSTDGATIRDRMQNVFSCP